MSWGIKIAIAYSSFVLFMLALVFASATQDFHLVREDYYAAELDYEHHLDRVRNAQALTAPVQVQLDADHQQILVQLPEDIATSSGQVLFYYPTDSHQDQERTWEQESGQEILLSPERLASGLVRIKINWDSEGTLYYHEQLIYLP
ncbi:MAG: FixH family protein [Bacteroidota bacterium]